MVTYSIYISDKLNTFDVKLNFNSRSYGLCLASFRCSIILPTYVQKDLLVSGSEIFKEKFLTDRTKAIACTWGDQQLPLYILGHPPYLRN